MAALTPSFKTPLIDTLNGYVLQSFTVTVTSDAAATEWIVTDMARILGVVGWAETGTAFPTQGIDDTALEVPVFKLNAAGTGDTPGAADLGLLGIEVLAATHTFDVTVIGQRSA